MSRSCSLCSSSVTVNQHKLMSCKICGSFVVSATITSVTEETNGFLLESVVGQAEKVFCEKCSCCKVIVPGHLQPFKMPEKGSLEEREILLKHGQMLMDKLETLERDLKFAKARESRTDDELNEFIKSNSRLEKRNKLLEKSLQNMMLDEGMSGVEHIVRLHEKLDDTMMENVSLKFDVDTMKDYCDMLLRRQEEMESMISSTLTEMNSGRYLPNVNVHMVELNCAEVKLAGLIVSSSSGSSSSSDIDENEQCKENCVPLTGKSSEDLFKQLKQEKFLLKMLKRKYNESQEQLEKSKEDNQKLKAQLKTALCNLEDLLQQTEVSASSPEAPYDDWSNNEEYNNWETNADSRYPPI